MSLVSDPDSTDICPPLFRNISSKILHKKTDRQTDAGHRSGQEEHARLNSYTQQT